MITVNALHEKDKNLSKRKNDNMMILTPEFIVMRLDNNVNFFPKKFYPL